MDRSRRAEGGSSLVSAKPRHSFWVSCRPSDTSTPGLRAQLLRQRMLALSPVVPTLFSAVLCRFSFCCALLLVTHLHIMAFLFSFKTRHLRQQKIKSVFSEVLTHNAATHISHENTLKAETTEMEDQVREPSAREEIAGNPGSL